MEEDTSSWLCHDCFQLCNSCLYSVELSEAACGQCLEAQLQHLEQAHYTVQAVAPEIQDLGIWEHVHPYAPSAGNIPVRSSGSNHLISKSTTSDVPSPEVRRRQWTDAENREFEKWISKHPKPTKQQKVQFAKSQTSLSGQQLQNKISNWKNGRNIQSQTARPPVRDDGLSNDLQSRMFEQEVIEKSTVPRVMAEESSGFTANKINQIRHPTTNNPLQGSDDRLLGSNSGSSSLPLELTNSIVSHMTRHEIVNEAVYGNQHSSLMRQFEILGEQKHRLIATTTDKDDELEAPGEALDDELASRSQSPVPSIERFLNSPELSASVESIKDALNQGAAPLAEDPLESGSSDGQRRRRSFGDLPLQRRASVYTAASSANSAASNASTQYSMYSTQSARVAVKLDRRERAAIKRSAFLSSLSSPRQFQKVEQLCPEGNCDFSYLTQSKLREHYRVSHDGSPIFCAYGLSCNKAFRDEAACRRHQNTHRQIGSILPGEKKWGLEGWFDQGLYDEPQPWVPRIIQPRRNKGALSTIHRQSYCTFCPRSFENPQSWQQHELQEHLSQQTWTCMLNGPYTPTEKGPACAFCLMSEPSLKHLEDYHNLQVCQALPITQRVFIDESIFRHHLSMRHYTNPAPDSTLREWTRYENIEEILWRCGICGIVGTSQSRRQDHIRNHWDNGSTMEKWLWASPEVIILSVEDYRDFMRLPELERQARIAELIPPQDFRPLERLPARAYSHRFLNSKAESTPTPPPLGLFASLGKKLKFFTRTRRTSRGQ